jgi:formylglycine-generating enzyme required for sulfatase activity
VQASALGGVAGWAAALLALAPLLVGCSDGNDGGVAGLQRDTYAVVDLTDGSVALSASVPDLLTNEEYKATKLVLRRVEPGEFVMGDRTTRPSSDALPPHDVRITRAFYLGVFEVTQGQWYEVRGDRPSFFVTDGERRPVEQVSWLDCQDFVALLSSGTGLPFRLPTEAEWEHACRAGTDTAYSYGQDPNDAYMWHHDNSHTVDSGGTHEVGLLLPNPWGLYDMHGNVTEWCEDWYDPDYYQYCVDHSIVDDPKGPPSGTFRSLRGGSWINCCAVLTSGYRGGNEPDAVRDYSGVRVAVSASAFEL